MTYIWTFQSITKAYGRVDADGSRYLLGDYSGLLHLLVITHEKEKWALYSFLLVHLFLRLERKFSWTFGHRDQCKYSTWLGLMLTLWSYWVFIVFIGLLDSGLSSWVKPQLHRLYRILIMQSSILDQAMVIHRYGLRANLVALYFFLKNFFLSWLIEKYFIILGY